MHIAINCLAVPPRPYGGGNYIRRLVGHLSKIDTDNQYTVYVSSTNSHHFSELGPNFNFVSSYSHRPLRILWEQTGLPRDLSHRKIDVFHGPAFVSPWVKVCPQVTTIFDMTWFLFPEKHTFVKRHYFKTMIPRSVRQSDVIIAISESVKKDIVRILDVPPEKVEVTYLGKEESFKPVRSAERLGRVRAKYGLTGKAVLFVGVVEPRKNLVRLIQAFTRLKALHGDYRLVIAGGFGWDYKEVLKAARESGIRERVLFTGFIPDEDLPELYNAAEVFVYPSLYEGFGLPVLEAMACGIPVITSNVSSMPEVAGDAGILVDPRSTADLAQALDRVLADSTLRKQMREKGLERSRLFSWEKTARQTLEIYRQVGRV